MAKYNVTVPPTMDQGNFKFDVDDKFGFTAAHDALDVYNSARAYDLQPPLKRMPNGTTYTRLYEYVIVGNYGYGDGYKDLTAEDTRTDAMLRLHEYRDNEPGVLFKVIARGL